MAPTQDPREHIVTSDPERIRALAHPLRLRILDVLDDEGEATATRCAEVTGESAASCSFHLRMLAKYGYVEPGERRGREKPWRPIGVGRSTRIDPDEPESVRAAAAMARILLGQEAERIVAWIHAASAEDPAWIQASTMSKSSFWATRSELDQLSREVESLTDRFQGRWQDAALRPEGSRAARMFVVANADPSPDAARGPSGGGRPDPGDDAAPDAEAAE